MPRKKQTVQKARRQKTYQPGSADAGQLKRTGILRYMNYTTFAVIGVVAISAGALFGVYQANHANKRGADGDVRGEGVIRSTPEANQTPTGGSSGTIKQYS